MSIYKVSTSLPISTKISTLNDMVLELEGLVEKGKFDINEIHELYTGSGLTRKYTRNESLGHTITTYTNWTHVYAEDSYSIWKYAPTSYTYNSVNKLYFDNKIIENRGQADSETALNFDDVFVYNGATYSDHTTAAATEGDTAFSLMAASTNYLYVGYSTTFKGVSFKFDTRGSNYTLVPEFYHVSAGWTGLTAEVDSLSEETSNFTGDGRISWDLTGSGSGWATTTINAATKYWVRFKTTTTPVTVAEADTIRPSNSVIELLALSSSEVLDEDWAWCEYNDTVYTTIRNKGVSSYEGSYYITSASSSTNKQNFFMYNHEYTSDYESTTYTGSGLSVSKLQIYNSRTPSSGASATTGNIEWDSSYIYVAVAPNSWKRATLSSF